MPQGLPRKLRLAFLLQVVMASLVIVAGAYAAVAIAISTSFARQSLQDEADVLLGAARAAIRRVRRPTGAPLHGYLVADGGSAVARAAGVARPAAGAARSRRRTCWCWCDEREGVRLYLVYAQSRIDRLRACWFAVVPMLLALLAVLASSWLTYRMSRRLVAPVNWLAREVAPLGSARDPMPARSRPTSCRPTPACETQQLAGALQRMGERIRAFVRRERDFTRDASHELRTPLTVIRVATDLMHGRPGPAARARSARWRASSAPAATWKR